MFCQALTLTSQDDFAASVAIPKPVGNHTANSGNHQDKLVEEAIELYLATTIDIRRELVEDWLRIG